MGHGRNRDAQLRPHTRFVSQRPDPPTPASAPFHKACLDRQWAGVSIPGYQHVQRAGRAEKCAYPTTLRVDKVKGSRRCQCRNPTDAHARFAVKAASAGRIQIVRLLFKPTGLCELVAPYRSAMGTPPPVDKQVAVGFNPRHAAIVLADQRAQKQERFFSPSTSTTSRHMHVALGRRMHC